ncbi:MAG: PKD domain-containing protein, partial [Terriglobia bacterium]
AGASIDKDAYPPSGDCTTPEGEFADPGPYSACLEDAQLQSELSTYVTKEKLPKGPTQLYFLLLPHKVVSCFPEEEVEIKEQACSNNAFCAYHSSIGAKESEEILYADIPFSLLDKADAKSCQGDGNPEEKIQSPNGDTTGTEESTRFADVALKYTSHEYIEAATDPTGEGWWEAANGQEIGDKCNFTGSGSEPGEDPNAFLPTLGGSSSSGTLFNQSINSGHFYLQSEWDNAANECRMEPLALSAAGFTPTSASSTAGLAVNFKGSATDPYGGELSFSWNFGDGNTGTGASPSHTYAAPGVYTVSMTPKNNLTDSTATAVSHTVTIAPIPLPPPVVPTPVPPAQTTTITTSTTALASAVAPNSAFNPPVATFNPVTGAITFTVSLGDPGAFSWLLTFHNGKFGVFAASNTEC